MIKYPTFASKNDLHVWLRENKDLLIHQKKSTTKHGDSLGISATIQGKEYEGHKLAGVLGKAESTEDGTSYPDGTIKARSVINTTNIIDSHLDLHVPGLWKKNLSEARMRYLLKQHAQAFEGVISRDVTASAKKYDWKALGFDYEGKTEALIFDSIIRPDVNPYMYDQYMKGFVLEHSVGMQYVKLFMCVNSTEKWWAEEKANWDKYIEMAVNPEVAEEYGFFWAVTEAKAIEGSAVLFGSNFATPTISITPVSSKAAVEDTADEDSPEPPGGTQDEPEQTDKSQQPGMAVNYSEIAKSILSLKQQTSK